MSQSATPATQNDMTTCLETFEKERICSFPHRHGDVSRKPETWDETRGRSKTSSSCETSANFDTFGTLANRLECHKVPCLSRKTTWQPAWKPSKRRGFAASPIDTELTTPCRPDDDATATRRATRGEQGVQPPDPPDYKREPFAPHFGKNPKKIYTRTKQAVAGVDCSCPLRSTHWFRVPWRSVSILQAHGGLKQHNATFDQLEWKLK